MTIRAENLTWKVGSTVIVDNVSLQAEPGKMLGLLGFPEDAMDRWAKGGMDLEQFQVLLLFATRKVSGKPITMAEAAETVAKAEAEKANPGNPRARRQRN